MRSQSLFKFLQSILCIGVLGFTSHLQAQSSLLEISSGRYEIRKIDSTSGQKRKPASVESEPSLKVDPKSNPAETSAVPSGPPAQVPAPLTAPVQTEGPQRTDLKFQATEISQELNQPRLEFSIGSILVSHKSESNYSYRDYETKLQALQLQGRFWVSSKVALEGQIINSLNGSIADSKVNQTQAPYGLEEMKLSALQQEEFSLGNRTRFSLSYIDSKHGVSSKAQAKLGYQSSGLGFGFQFHTNESPQHLLIFSADLYPRLSHKENSGTTSVSSGSAPQSSRVDLGFGGEYHLNPRSVFIWGLDLNYTKNLFEGPASASDPITSVTPQNVSVDQSSFIFKLGYRWGR